MADLNRRRLTAETSGHSPAVVVWLRSLGLGKYEAIFRENDTDETVLPNLTAEGPALLELRG